MNFQLSLQDDDSQPNLQVSLQRDGAAHSRVAQPIPVNPTFYQPGINAAYPPQAIASHNAQSALTGTNLASQL